MKPTEAERNPKVDPQPGDRVKMGDTFPVPKTYRGRTLEVSDRSDVSLSGRKSHKVSIKVVRLDGTTGKLGGCYLLSTWRKWHSVLPKKSGAKVHSAFKKWKKGKQRVARAYPKPTAEELQKENTEISEAADKFHAEMKGAKVLGVPMTPLMGMASLALGLFLPPGSPERRRAVSGAMSLFSRHSICHLAEGGKLVEGFPEKATDDGPRRPNLFETMFKKREEETHEP